MKKHLTPTMTTLSKCRSFSNQQTTNLLLRHRLVLHELLQLLNVRWIIEQQTITLHTISTTTTRFLIIPFQTLRHIIVDHKPHIRLIDAHSKRNGSHNHIAIFHQKRVLMMTTNL